MKYWRTALGLVISAGFILFALRGQDFGRIREALGAVNYWYILPGLGLYFLGVWMRSYRWSVLLRPLLKVSTADVAPITVVGFMANNVLPLRTGEIVRAYALSKRFGVRKTSALATIAVERLFDGLTMLGFMLAAATVVGFTSELRSLAIVAFVLFAVALIGLFALTARRQPARPAAADRARADAGIGRRPRRADGGVVPLRVGGAEAQGRPGAGGRGVAAWPGSCEASMYLVIARGFGAGSPTSWASARRC